MHTKTKARRLLLKENKNGSKEYGKEDWRKIQ